MIYADITYVIDRIRSVLIVSHLSDEDEYQIYQLENLVHFPIQYYICNRIEKNEVKRLLLIDGRQNQKRRSTAEQTLSENHALIMHRFRQSRTGIRLLMRYRILSNTAILILAR